MYDDDADAAGQRNQLHGRAVAKRGKIHFKQACTTIKVSFSGVQLEDLL